MKLLNSSETPTEISELFEDSISPIKLSYFESIDQNLNIKCLLNYDGNYEENKVYGPYEIKPILRVLLIKSKIIDEKSISEIFKTDTTEVCLVLQFDQKIQKFLIINLENLDYFKDKQLSKILSKKTSEILMSFESRIKELKND